MLNLLPEPILSNPSVSLSTSNKADCRCHSPAHTNVGSSKSKSGETSASQSNPLWSDRADSTEAHDDNTMEDDEENGPLDMTGSDILPPLAHSTNPLFPNAIVKKPPTNAKYTTKAAKAPAEDKEPKKAAAVSGTPPAAPKPYVGKNGPVSFKYLLTVFQLTTSPPHRVCRRDLDGVLRLVMRDLSWRKLELD